MKIRRCPNCAELVHFEAHRPLKRCWNCALVSDFSPRQTAVGKCLSWAGSLLDRSTSNYGRLIQVGKCALLVAVPFVVVMLLACNSLNITLVHEASAPFTMP